MKAIQMFFQMLSEYQKLKTELKCRYETHKLECRLRYDNEYKAKFFRE
jgi:hypothetical protein